MIDGIKPCGMMMGNPFGNMTGFIIRLRGDGGFTIRGCRLITTGRLGIGGGGGFGWLIAKWKAMLVEDVELIKAWKSIGFWWLIWLGLNIWPLIVFFVT